MYTSIVNVVDEWPRIVEAVCGWTPCAHLRGDPFSQVVEVGAGIETGLRRQPLERLGEMVGVDGSTVATVADHVAVVAFHYDPFSSRRSIWTLRCAPPLHDRRSSRIVRRARLSLEWPSSPSTQ